MKASLYGISFAGLFRLIFWIGMFFGILIQYWIPQVGKSIVWFLRYTILLVASWIT